MSAFGPRREMSAFGCSMMQSLDNMMKYLTGDFYARAGRIEAASAGSLVAGLTR